MHTLRIEHTKSGRTKWVCECGYEHRIRALNRRRTDDELIESHRDHLHLESLGGNWAKMQGGLTGFEMNMVEEMMAGE